MSNKNRLAELFKDFANKFELPAKIDGDQIGANLGIPEAGKLIQASYTFDPSQDSYEFGAALARIEPSEQGEIAKLILTSEPIKGITERIIGDKLIILGGRDNLDKMTDNEITADFMDDTARISEYYKHLINLLPNNET